MDYKHITSDTLRRLLELTEKKDQLIKAVEVVENEIAKAISGAATTAVDVAEAVTPFKPKAVKTPKAGKASKAPKKAKRSGTGRSGALKDRILAVLEAAGSQGMRVKEIAEALGVKAGNVSVWFSTTGKNITNKLQPGRYSVYGSAPSASVEEKAPKAAKAPKKGRRTKAAKTSKVAKAKKPAKAARSVKTPKAAKAGWGSRKAPSKTNN